MNDINKLREHLFSALEGLASDKIDIEKAKAISEVGRTIIQSAQVEVNYMRAGGHVGSSNFINGTSATLPAGCTSPRPGVTQHRLK